MFTSITVNADGTVTVGMADSPLADGGVAFDKHDPDLSDLLSVVMDPNVPATVCPVSDIAGDHHTFPADEGIVIPWSVMGDERTAAMVCRSCAEHSGPEVCDNCGTAVTADDGNLCDPCFEKLPTGEWHTAGDW